MMGMDRYGPHTGIGLTLFLWFIKVFHLIAGGELLMWSRYRQCSIWIILDSHVDGKNTATPQPYCCCSESRQQWKIHSDLAGIRATTYKEILENLSITMFCKHSFIHLSSEIVRKADTCWFIMPRETCVKRAWLRITALKASGGWVFCPSFIENNRTSGIPSTAHHQHVNPALASVRVQFV